MAKEIEFSENRINKTTNYVKQLRQNSELMQGAVNREATFEQEVDEVFSFWKNPLRRIASYIIKPKLPLGHDSRVKSLEDALYKSPLITKSMESYAYEDIEREWSYYNKHFSGMPVDDIIDKELLKEPTYDNLYSSHLSHRLKARNTWLIGAGLGTAAAIVASPVLGPAYVIILGAVAGITLTIMGSRLGTNLSYWRLKQQANLMDTFIEKYMRK